MKPKNRKITNWEYGLLLKIYHFLDYLRSEVCFRLGETMKPREFICWALRDDDVLFDQGWGVPNLYPTKEEAEKDIRNPRLSAVQVSVTVKKAHKH